MEANVVDSRSSAGGAAWRRTAVLALVAAVAAGFLLTVALPYLSLDRERMGVYWPRRGWLILHILGGMAALMLGPIQLWLGLGRRALRLHRRLGVGYAASVAISSLAAYYLAYNTSYGWVFGSGLVGLATAWIVTTSLAVFAICRGLVQQHREWTIRSYVVTFAFVTFRVFFEILEAAHVGTTLEQLAVSSWFCWSVPLLLTEGILQGRKIVGEGRLRVSAAVVGNVVKVSEAAPQILGASVAQPRQQ
jgi:hypothetical protein